MISERQDNKIKIKNSALLLKLQSVLQNHVILTRLCRLDANIFPPGHLSRNRHSLGIFVAPILCDSQFL